MRRGGALGVLSLEDRVDEEDAHRCGLSRPLPQGRDEMQRTLLSVGAHARALEKVKRALWIVANHRVGAGRSVVVALDRGSFLVNCDVVKE